MELPDLSFAAENPQFVSPVSAWIEHIPFAFALMELLRPETFVELGTHAGDSYLAFCQAAARLKPATRCTAIDTWEGDTQAGSYSSRILDKLRAYHNPLYASFSRLLPSTFDNALPQFPDGSIDLLHIDGLHTYEAVKHDFESWRRKLSPRGVVLFHDTQVRRDDFGVYRLWEELAAQYPSFEFHHGYGLGVLAVGDQPPPRFAAFLSAARENPTTVRQLFQALGNRLQLARGAAGLSEALARQRPTIEGILGLFDKHRPAPAPAISPDLLDPPPHADDLKLWFDARLETAAAQNQLIGGLAGHIQWLQNKLETLQRDLTPWQRSVRLMIFWPDAKGAFDPARSQMIELPADGSLQTATFSRDLDGSPMKTLRLDPLEGPGFFLLAGLTVRITQPGRPQVEIALRPSAIQKAINATVLHAPPQLADQFNAHYTLFSASDDPQLHVRMDNLLPPNATHIDVVVAFRALELLATPASPASASLARHMATLLSRAR